MVSQLHVVSVHVKDHESFNSLFLFFRDTLKLPLLYGELTRPENAGKTMYAGFSAGNCYFEPCGPYAFDAAFPLNQSARFHGLTFSPTKSAPEIATALDLQGFDHSDIIPPSSSGEDDDTARLIYLKDARFVGKWLAVSIWEIRDKKDPVNHPFLRSSLSAAKGGALGLKWVKEVRVGYAARNSRDRWTTFLTPATQEGELCHIGDGPAIRFVQAQENCVESVVLKVESLRAARTFLADNGLLGKDAGRNIELDERKARGLRIVLEE